MKVIAINSSAGNNGNTAILLKTVLNELHKEGFETELIQLAGQTIAPCKACWGCSGHGNCIHKNDIFYELFEKLKDADGILLGSPVYSANISANMQAFLERASVICDMNDNPLKHKAGAGVAAARRGGAMHAIDALHHFFLNHEMFVVGSTYWNFAYGQMPGDVYNDTEGLNNMKNIGQNMSHLLKALKEYKDSKQLAKP